MPTAPTFVSGGTDVASGTGAAITITTPAGSAGDTLVAAFHSDGGGTPSFSGVTGWALAASLNYVSTHTLYVYTHLCTGSEAGTFTISGGSTYTEGTCLRYAGVDTVAPVNTSGSSPNESSPNVTTSSDATVGIVFLDYDGGSNSFAAPAGWTRRLNGAGAYNFYIADRTWATQGATGSTSFVGAGSTGGVGMGDLHIVLNPVGAGTAADDVKVHQGHGGPAPMARGPIGRGPFRQAKPGWPSFVSVPQTTAQDVSVTQTQTPTTAASKAFLRALAVTLTQTPTMSRGSGHTQTASATLTQTPTLTPTKIPASNTITFTATQADGPATDFSSSGSPHDIEVVSNRYSSNNYGPLVTNYASGYHTLPFSVATDLQADFDCSAPLGIGHGGVQLQFRNLVTGEGYGVFVGNAYHVYEFPSGGGSGTFLTNVGRSTRQEHITFTRRGSDGLMTIYADGVAVASAADTTTVAGQGFVLYLVDTDNPTTEAWADNIVITNVITGPPSGTTTPQALSATLTQTPTVARSTAHAIAVTQAETPTAARVTAHIRTLAVTQSQTPSIVRALPRTLSATLTQTPTMARGAGHGQTLSATQTQTPAVTRSIAHALAATQTQTPTRTSPATHPRALAVTQTQTATQLAQRAFLRAISVTLSQTPAVARQAAKAIATIQTQTATAARTSTKPLSATQTQTPTATRAAAHPRTLAVTQTETPATTRATGKPITVTQAQSTTLTTGRAFLRALAATLTQTPTSSRAIGKTAAVTQVQTPAVARSTAHPLSVVQTQTPTATRRTNRTMAVTQTQTATLAVGRALLRTIAVTQTQTAAAARGAAKAIAVTLTQTPSSKRTTAHLVDPVTQTQTPTATRGTAHKLATTQTQTAALAVGRALLRALNVTQTQTPTAARTATHPRALSTTQAQTPTVKRTTGHIVSADQTQTPTLARVAALHRTLAATVAQAPTLIRALPRTLSATQTQTATLARARTTARALAATNTQTATVVRRAGKALSATVGQTTALSRLRTTVARLDVALSQTPALRRAIAKAIGLTQTQTATMISTDAGILALAGRRVDYWVHGGATEATITGGAVEWGIEQIAVATINREDSHV